MADEKTNADSLRVYLTGAAADGGAQADPDASLGKYRSSTEVEQLAATVTNPIANITIDYISGNNGTGAGSLQAVTADTIAWYAPGESNGDVIAIANGETKVVESDTTSKYVRVTRTSADAMSGTATVTLANVTNNVTGSSDLSSAESSAGVTKYRCICFKNDHATDSVTVLKAWLNTLGTQRVSATTQLGADGEVGGTIAIAAGTFDDWPETGYCRIEEADTTEREIVYYTSRTSTVLTVPAAGRELLGTTAAAGAADDTVDAVPGIRIAKDAPDAQPDGVFEDETASDEVDPGVGSWASGIVAADGISIGTLTAGQIYGLWIERETPAGYVASPNIENAINWSFDV